MLANIIVLANNLIECALIKKMNLSGMWLGTYWQNSIPSRFEMTLVHSANTITGNILDDNYLGEANLSGEAIGRKINFTKTYLTGSRGIIYYVGTLSEDGNFISGQWQIDSFNSGNWEAHRSEDNLTLNLDISKVKKVPTSV